MLLVSGGQTLGQTEAAREEARKNEATAQKQLQNQQKEAKLNKQQKKPKSRRNADTMEVSIPNYVAS